MKKLFLMLIPAIIFASQSGFEYLNTHRTNAGMIPFKANKLLNDATNNHALYLVFNNQRGHNQAKMYKNFTGVVATNRVNSLGYDGIVSESITTGDSDSSLSIDKLFSQIYHRFLFLHFLSDEIGTASYISKSYAYDSVFVYNMGVSKMRELCEGESFEGAGKFYDNVCIDSKFKIQSEMIDSERDKNRKANPKIVLWPYPNQIGVPPVFYEEKPDPLPECSVSGYPISVQFNSYYFKEVSINSFKLYNEDGDEISHTKILTNKSDPNMRFTKHQFALFPLKRLNFDTQYRVEIEYVADGESYTKRWNFTTKKVKYPMYKVLDNNQTISIKAKKPYAFHLSPKECNDNAGRYEFDFGLGKSVKILKHNFIDKNTFRFEIDGNVSDIVKVKLENGVYFNLKIVDSNITKQ